MAFGEEFALGQARKELGDRRLDGVDLRLVGLGGIPGFPIDRRERAEFGAALAHPGDKLLVRAPPRRAAVEDEIDVAVAAGPEHAIARALDRAAGHEGAGTRRLDADEVDERRRVRQRGDDGGLGGDIHEIAAAGGVAAKQRNEGADGGVRAGPAVGLRLAHPHRHAVGLAGERHSAAGGHELDVACLPCTARADAAERPDRDDHQARIIPAQGERIETGDGRSRREQTNVGGAQQFLDPRARARRFRIEFENPLVDVESAPFRAAAVAAGRFELDDIGAEIGEQAPREPAEPIRGVDDQHVRQQHGATLFTARARAEARR